MSLAVPQTLPPPLLVGDQPALDFLNTHAFPAGEAVEWIGSGDDWRVWLATAGLGPPATDADAEARAARTLREWLRGMLEARGPAGLDAADGLAPLNALLAQDARVLHLAPSEVGGAAKTWMSIATPAWPALQRVASAIADLLTDEDPALVRRCEGRGCTLWFLDRTKSHGRRWCSMAACGNRAKAAAHRARHRAE